MKTRPILTLLLLTVVVPELLTGSTPLPSFLNPGLLLFLGLGYGLVILLIRELAARHDIGLCGLIFFGLAYGLVNEGLLAKTLIIQNHIPVPQYDDYGVALGISLPWAAVMSAWHGFASVVFPIALTHFIFPKASHQPWLNGPIAVILGTALLVLMSFLFLGTSEKGVKGTPLQLAILIAAMLALFCLGFIFKGRLLGHSGAPSCKPMFLGFSIVVPFVLLATLAGAKMNLLIFFPALAVAFPLYGWLLKRFGWLSLPGFLCFSVGWYLQNAVVSILAIMQSNPLLAAISALVDILILILVWRQVRRKSETFSKDQDHGSASVTG